MTYLAKLIEVEINQLHALEGDSAAYMRQVHKCFRLILDYFKYHEHEGEK